MRTDVIYDIGMHTGNDTAFYLACGYHVVSVEADPDLVASARIRFQKEIDEGRLVVLNLAIAETPGSAEFWINEVRPAMNSFDRALTARAGEPHHSIRVECARLDDILAKHGSSPVYIKIDIEGHDLICCKQLTPEIKPTYISVEMSREELIHCLKDLGYDQFKLVNQLDLASPVTPAIPVLQRFLRLASRTAHYRLENRNMLWRGVRQSASGVLHLARRLGWWENVGKFQSKRVPDWNFYTGAVGSYSGSFGDDLPGEWLTSDQIARIWNRDVIDFQKLGRQLSYDLHATTSAPRR